MTPDVTETEEAIISLLCDEDDQLLPSESLSVLVNIVAGICCLGSDPFDLSAQFVASLERAVASGLEINRRTLS